MQLLWFLVGLLVVVNAAVPEGPRIEGSKRLTQTVDCNGAVVFSAVSSKSTFHFFIFYINSKN